MKYGFTLPGRGPLATPETLGRIARTGEDLGYDALFTGDHILVPRNIASPYPYTEGGEFPGSPSGESMEQLTLLAFLAGQTSSIRPVDERDHRAASKPAGGGQGAGDAGRAVAGAGWWSGLAWAGCGRSSRRWDCRRSRRGARLQTSTSGRSRSCGPAMTLTSRASM